MKIIRVGDPHVRPDNLEESERLMQFIYEAAKSPDIGGLEFLGDQMHTHAVLRMEVVEFWMKWAKKFGSIVSTKFLVGNHDQPGDYQRERTMHSMSCLEGISGVYVISTPWISDKTLYIPHMSKQEDFVAAIQWAKGQGADLSKHFLVCHQTFNGSMYENGFYAKDGFDPSIVSDFRAVICGHIHKQQQFFNILYIGTPKWDSISDANEEKGIWIFEDLEASFCSTANVCTPIKSISLSEGDPIPEIPEGRILVTLEGSQAWIASVSKDLKGKVRLIPKPTDSKIKTQEFSDKLSSIENYAKHHKFDPSVTAEDVLTYLKDLT